MEKVIKPIIDGMVQNPQVAGLLLVALVVILLFTFLGKLFFKLFDLLKDLVGSPKPPKTNIKKDDPGGGSLT